MSDRFDGLRKLSGAPAARLLAEARVKLGTRLDAPASAPVRAVLAELDAKAARLDALRLLSVALPPREAVWWGCLAIADTLPEGAATPSLRAAEGWVRRPDADARAAAQRAMEAADPDDDTAVIAVAAYYAPGDMGDGEMAAYDAPPGAVANCVFAANVQALSGAGDADGMRAALDLLLARGLDIARGGSGRMAGVAAPAGADA